MMARESMSIYGKQETYMWLHLGTFETYTSTIMNKIMSISHNFM